ncbi:MAG: hypothetical protein KC492_28225, partial [Myxococcales bacterium]|nr:hypothetical protein [Myxococcales bacterium]
SLPTIDLDVLEEHGQKLPRWPDAANGDFDGELSAALKLLLADHPALTKLLEKYGAAFSFFDLDPDEDDDAQLAADLAREITRLMDDLSSRGQAALIERLEQVLGRKIPPEEAASLAAGLPVDLVEQANLDWFAGKAREDTPIEKAQKHPGGGWFKSDSTLSVRYAPSGHADPLLKSWIDLIVSLDDSTKLIRQSALAELATPNSPGQCLTCHSTEQSAGGKPLVNWRPLDPVTRPRSFTRFAHAPHTTIKDLADCESCHRLDKTANSSASYASQDPAAFVSHFLPITKADCAQCHTPHAAGDTCMQCHNYHVDAAGLLERTPRRKPSALTDR